MGHAVVWVMVHLYTLFFTMLRVLNAEWGRGHLAKPFFVSPYRGSSGVTKLHRSPERKPLDCTRRLERRVHTLQLQITAPALLSRLERN